MICRTSYKSALVYAVFVPDSQVPETTQGTANSGLETQTQRLLQRTPKDTDQLQLLVVTADGKAIGRRVPNTTRSQVVAMASLLRSRITDPRQPRHRYIPMAEQLDQWLVAPIKRDLQAEGIQNLVYIMDVGLRSLPMAALYDGRKFLVERYSIGMMPSLGLTNTQYQDALMTAFYQQLKQAPMKAQALQQAQLAMLRGEVRLEGGKLRTTTGEKLPLPPELAKLEDRDFSHPNYWSGFTMIGSPW